MGYKTILQILLILAIISTLCICIMKPQMHKSVLVYNSDYIVMPTQETETEVQEVPVMEMTSGSKPEDVKVDNSVETQTFDFAQPELSYSQVINTTPQVVTQSTPIAKKEAKVNIQKVDVTTPRTYLSNPHRFRP